MKRFFFLLFPLLFPLCVHSMAFDSIVKNCHEFLYHLRCQEEELAYYQNTSTSYRRVVRWEQFTSFIGSHTLLCSSEHLLIGKVSQDRELAAVEGLLIGSKGGVAYIQFQLERDGPEFKLNKISIKEPSYSFSLQ